MRMDILIVEDQRRIAEGLSVMLSSCKEDGIQIERTLIADNGVQALKMLEQQRSICSSRIFACRSWMALS